MAKRRADDFVPLHAPSKRRCRSLRLVDTQRGSASPAAGVGSPSLLVVPAGRARKRSGTFEDPEQTQEEAAVGRKMTRASPVLMERTSGCSPDPCSANSAPTCSEPWPREDWPRLDTISPKIREKADEHTQAEDCRFNSFQFWRSPVPALDLSLLEDPEEDKSKDKDSCHAMETG